MPNFLTHPVTRRAALARIGLIAGASATSLPAHASASASVAASGASASSLLMMNPRGRTYRSLAGRSESGEWRVIVDPYDTGYYDYRRRPNPNGYFRDESPSSPSALQEYDFDTSPTLSVPGDWNSQDPQLALYEGAVWYRRRFVGPDEGTRHTLRFEAVSLRCQVWLDGESLGEHEGGFTPFEFDVTDRVNAGQEHSLVLRVLADRREDAVPTVATDWWNYAGVIRDVLLVSTASHTVADARLELANDAGDRLVGWAVVDPPEPGHVVALSIPELEVDVESVTDDEGVAHFSVDAEPERWRPLAARLYDVSWRLGEDTVTDRIGFRTLRTEGPDILVNEEPTFLRGISMHDERLGLEGGRPRNDAERRALLDEVLALGCNFVRLAHYPHDEATVRLCDELGLMVWAEIPVYWTIDFESEATLRSARLQLTELVLRDRRRCSVVLWSVGNETPVSPARTEFLRTLVRDVRALDSTRLLTAALEQHAITPEEREVSDPLGEDLDVLGLNQYLGWYDRLPGDFEHVSWSTVWEKPLVISEFGAGVLCGREGPATERWTEAYGVALYQEQLRMLSRIPNLRGMSPWILKDFRSPRRPLPVIQDFWNRKGLLAPDGTRKGAWEVLRDHYAALASK